MDLLGHICSKPIWCPRKASVRSLHFALQVLGLFPELTSKCHGFSFQIPELSGFKNKPQLSKVQRLKQVWIVFCLKELFKLAGLEFKNQKYQSRSLYNQL